MTLFPPRRASLILMAAALILAAALVGADSSEKTWNFLPAVQIGAPDRDGLVFPSDEIILDLAVERLVGEGLALANTRRVFLHYWRTGKVLEVPARPAS